MGARTSICWAPQGKALAGVEEADGGAGGAGLGEELVEGLGVGGYGDPELAGAEVAEDGGHAAHVVGVGVGEDEGVEAADAAGPEVGGDDFLADVEGGGGGGGLDDGAGGSAGVDEHGVAFGADDEQGVALADVDGGELEGVGGEEGGLGPEDGEGDERQDVRAAVRAQRAAAAGSPAAEGPGAEGEGNDGDGGWGDAGVGERDAAQVADAQGNQMK